MKDEDIKKIAKDVVKVMLKSKAIFFVNRKGNKILEIPAHEQMYELKSALITDVEMYFYNLLNPKSK